MTPCSAAKNHEAADVTHGETLKYGRDMIQKSHVVTLLGNSLNTYR